MSLHWIGNITKCSTDIKKEGRECAYVNIFWNADTTGGYLFKASMYASYVKLGTVS